MTDLENNRLHLVDALTDIFESDQWDFVDDLNYKKGEVPSSCNKLTFSVYADGWFKEWVKQTCWKKRNLVTASTLVAYNRTLKSFYRFALNSLEQPSDLNRRLLVKYMDSLRSKSNATQKAYFGILRELTVCWQEWGWIANATPLFHREDAPRNEPSRKPRALSTFVQSQVIEAISKEDTYLTRLIAVYLEVGARGLEVLRLPFDCIHKDSEGWYLTRDNLKYRNQHVVPISNDLAEIIKRQQEFARDVKERYKGFWVESELLFLHYNRKRQSLTGYTLRNVNLQLRNFCEKHQIKNESGKINYISSHQFRHTVGTNLINNGVSQHHVAKFLGHASPTMTAVYAQIHDSTLRNAVQGAITSFVDIKGTLYKPDNVLKDVAFGVELENALDAMWLRKHISAQTLPNGLCSLPIAQSCDHANACLSCPNFRTDKTHLEAHKNQLNRTKDLITCALKSGYVRQAEVNTRVKENLETIIEALEVA